MSQNYIAPLLFAGPFQILRGQGIGGVKPRDDTGNGSDSAYAE